MSDRQASPGISAISFAFPRASRSVEELGEQGLLESRPELLREFGFDRVYVAEEETAFGLAAEAAEHLLRERSIEPESIDLLLYAGTPGTLAFAPGAEIPTHGAAFRTTDRFKYPATRLQHELGLSRAAVIGVEQLACTSLFGAIRLARAVCIADGVDRVLCVASEFFPADAGREAIFNCTSDACVALLVERQATRNRIRSAVHVSKGYYWDCDARSNEIVASYFPTSRHVMLRAIEEAGWTPSDIDWILPHNVSVRSWEILSGLVRLPNARLRLENIPRHGHTLAGDNFITLHDALRAGAIEEGDRLLLFSYGYGAHWAALTLEA